MFKSFLELKNKANRHRDLIFGLPDQKLANPSGLRPTPLDWVHRAPPTLLTFDPVGQKRNLGAYLPYFSILENF